MDRLHGLDSLDVVYRRFSNGVEVVRCVLEFCKVIGDVEQSYSNSMHKLMKSSSYTLHSNIIMQWLGSDPFQEIGTLKHCWQKLGSELGKLADLHSEKAAAYLETVRRPLVELIPQLEETRKQLKMKMQMLRTNLEIAEKKYLREKQKYSQMGESYGKLKERVMQGNMSPDPNLNKLEARLSSQRRDMELQECVYKEAHTCLSLAHDNFNVEMSELYQLIQEKELERVKTVKGCLQEFAKTLSNTAPAYLESMQQIVISVDEIDGTRDIEHFVKDHQDLLELPVLPEFSLHESREGDEGSYTASMGPSPRSSSPNPRLYSHENGSLYNGERTPSPSLKRNGQENLSFDHERRDSGDEMKQENKNGDTVLKKPSGVSVAKKLNSSEYQNDQLQSNRADSRKQQMRSEGASKVQVRRPRPSTKPSLPGRKLPIHNENVIKGASPITTSSSSFSTSSSSYTANSTTNYSNTESSSFLSSSSSQSSSMAQKVDTTKPHPQSTKSVAATKPRVALNPSSKPNVVVRTTKPPQTEVSTKPPPPPTKNSPDLDSLLRPKARQSSTAATATAGAFASLQPGPTYQTTAATISTSTLPSSGSTRSSASRHSSKPHHSLHQGSAASIASKSLNPAVIPPNVDPREYQLLSQLRDSTTSCDYYRLFDVEADASAEDIAKARREKSREFHPDHYGNDPERRAKAEERLRLINQVFQDVMKTKEKRALYDQLCRFRTMYSKIVQQPSKGLEAAQGKLSNLQRSMKKARLPLELQNEIQLALNLIQTRVDNLSKES